VGIGTSMPFAKSAIADCPQKACLPMITSRFPPLHVICNEQYSRKNGCTTGMDRHLKSKHGNFFFERIGLMAPTQILLAIVVAILILTIFIFIFILLSPMCLPSLLARCCQQSAPRQPDWPTRTGTNRHSRTI
jgi:hypothetical protein